MSITVLTSAHADVYEDAFRDFTACDAGFFKAIHREPAAWKSLAPLATSGNYSWLKIRNRHKEGDNLLDLAAPLPVAGLNLVSFFDEISDLDSLGLYYYWGFTVPGKVDDVARQLTPLIQNSERFRRDGPVYVRTEVKFADTGWLPLATYSNTPAGLEKIERVFLIEPHESVQNLVRVSCSLQGAVSAEVLKEIRPDIAPEDYPKKIAPIEFDDAQVPERVTQVASKTSWAPKFKRLSYTYRAKRVGQPLENLSTVEMEAQGGLVRVRENYTTFNVQRLMLAGLVQLKSRMNGTGDGRVTVTTKLEMSLPDTLRKGDKLSVHEIMQRQPAKADDSDSRVTILCDVVEEVAAESIYSTLTGRAFRLSCTSGKENDTSNKVYLEDLGIFVPLGGKSEFGDWTYQLIRFEIER